MKVEIEVDEKAYGLLCKPDEVEPLFKALSELYQLIWSEAVYEPMTNETKTMAALMLPHIQTANKILGFKK